MKMRAAAPAALALSTALVLAGCSAGTTDPADADVMFVSMMAVHHEQAIEMSDVLLTKDDVDPEVAGLAREIQSAQEPEIDQLRAWLADWGVEDTDQDMAGMDHGDGMVADDDLAELDAADGPEASRLFLTQMIEHHEGAVEMARTQIEDGTVPEVTDFARTVVEDQTAEIERMRSMLGDTGTATDTAALLDRYGLTGLDAAGVIDRLDALPVDERPTGLMASVRPDVLLLSDQDTTAAELPMPADRVYVSVAPYREQTHDCWFHSLTTCRGELANTEVRLSLVADDGEVLVDETRTTFDNGFTGLWLPRGIEGELTVEADGRTGTATLSTVGDEDATCVTTLRLS